MWSPRCAEPGDRLLPANRDRVRAPPWPSAWCCGSRSVRVGQDFFPSNGTCCSAKRASWRFSRIPRAVRIWLFRWLVFRLMFFSGLVKLRAATPPGAISRRCTTTIETQPLPDSAGLVHAAIAAVVPESSDGFRSWWSCWFRFCFLRRAARAASAPGSPIALQVLILLTGNYTFFNFLTIALCMWLFIEPEKRPRVRTHRAVNIGAGSIHRRGQRAGFAGEFSRSAAARRQRRSARRWTHCES